MFVARPNINVCAHTSNSLGHISSTTTCADPENVVRGGRTLTSFFFLGGGGGGGGLGYEGRSDPKCHYKRANICTPAKRHLNGVSLVGR